MDIDEARRIAERCMVGRPDGDAWVQVEEYELAFVASWASTTPQAPGGGRVAVPKDGSPVRHLGSQQIGHELHRAGLGPEPESHPRW